MVLIVILLLPRFNGGLGKKSAKVAIDKVPAESRRVNGFLDASIRFLSQCVSQPQGAISHSITLHEQLVFIYSLCSHAFLEQSTR